MSNTPLERSIFRSAVNMLRSRYGFWITSPNNTYLNDLQDAKLDVLVSFMNHREFMTNRLLSGKPESGCTVLGFCDYLYATPKIYINRTHAKSTTVVHELLHFVTHDNFRKKVPSLLNEGVTEYFTRKIQTKFHPTDEMADFKDDRQSYPDEYRRVGTLRTMVKVVLRPEALEARKQPIEIGRQRHREFMPDPTRGANTRHFVKKAYFEGDMRLIDMMCDIW